MDQPVSMQFGLIELLRAAMLTSPFLFESYGKYCVDGMEQFVSIYFARSRKAQLYLIEFLLAEMLIWMDCISFTFESFGEYCSNGMKKTQEQHGQPVRISFA